MAKYVTVEISGIITQIAKSTEIKGYTEGILECFLPDNDTTQEMTEPENNKWIRENNKRMKAICKFLNDSNL